MLEYEQKYGHLPPAFVPDAGGRPAHSWRVLLLEFLDPQRFSRYRFDESWDSEHNLRLADRMPSCYSCPATPEDRQNNRTNYFVVIGPGTAFPGPRPVKLTEINRPHADTLLVVEATGQGVHWMEPRDIPFERLGSGPGKVNISSQHRLGPGGLNAAGRNVLLDGIGPEQVREKLLIYQGER